ncbi:DNA-binding response OmpR family regulator [Devosia sp. UYZn731]|uniref:response regulator n=1 Tax=Devosia sp. UYZn731 TaxID=3156345 RepID=UPI003398003E
MTEHTEITRRAKAVEPRSVEPTVGQVRGTKRLLALLLEDEPLIAMDVEMTLERAGFDVINLMSREEATTWLDLHFPDVVIVDVDLRDGRCTDVVSRLFRANIPFVVHSGQEQHKFADSPFASGTWVGKPSIADDLANVVKNAANGFSRPVSNYVWPP